MYVTRNDENETVTLVLEKADIVEWTRIFKEHQKSLSKEVKLFYLDVLQPALLETIRQDKRFALPEPPITMDELPDLTRFLK